MSRVDEAIRRAANAAPSESELAALATETAGPDETWTLGQDAYPVESGAAAPAAPPAQPAAAAAAPKPPAVVPAPQTVRQPVPAGDTLLYERIDRRLTEKVVIDQNISAASREQYRRLAAVLHDASGTTGLQVVMIASAVGGEGKTLTATNLALTLSESYQKRVLLIDGDLRRPTLHSVFRLETTSGLADGLLSSGETKMMVRQVSPYLAVLPAGRPSSDPMAGLTSERMKRLLSESRQSFDWVILDTPPILLLPDAHLMASIVDGVVLVVRAGSTPFEQVRRAADAMERSRIVGVVLNRAEPTGQHDPYQYYYAEGDGQRD